MDWLQSINKAIKFIEQNITNKICVEDVSKQAYASNAHFQRIFNLVTGITIGEYIRNRRLSLAGRDLRLNQNKVSGIAMKYQYDTSESFSKAFNRFHGINPSEVKAKSDVLKFYYPLTVNFSITGGFDMSNKLIEEFCWNDIKNENNEILSDTEKYQMVVDWAGRARGQNPRVFDSLTEWILDDSEWTEDKLIENEQIFMQGVLARFKQQNEKLRGYLKDIKNTDVVNDAVFNALDRFDDELSGHSQDKGLQEIVGEMFSKFSIMKERSVREKIGGGLTGSFGTDSVELFGYINYLKNCDAGVQWALFMPQAVERQQKGFKIESFEYKKLRAMRFVGKECNGHDPDSMNWKMEIMSTLDNLREYKSGFDYDILFMHHYGKGVDVEKWHGFWGRFMSADTPVPDGFVSFDFVPTRDINNFVSGAPFFSQFAFSKFSGDVSAMHKFEGYDSNAMYDVTRNIILGQGVNIPYPEKYWTAEVFLNGCNNFGTAYLFSVEL